MHDLNVRLSIDCAQLRMCLLLTLPLCVSLYIQYDYPDCCFLSFCVIHHLSHCAFQTDLPDRKHISPERAASVEPGRKQHLQS